MKLSEFFKKNQLVRDADVKLTHFANQNINGLICFVLNEGYIHIANKNSAVKAIITTKEYASLVENSKGLVISNNPKYDYYLLHNYMYEQGYMQIVKNRFIDPSSQVASTAIIQGNVHIGKNVIIDEYTIIKDQTVIGDNTYIGSHCIIGARGLNNTKTENGFTYVKDAGGVQIGKNCEILDASIIQKSIHKEMTCIGNNSKISVKVNIAHGVNIGEKTLIAGNTQISGYVTIGNDVWIGPSVTVSHNLKILDNAQIKIGSVVIKSVKKEEEVSGNFAYKHSLHLKNYIKAQK